jgi:ATP-dependent Clp protease ATP-binding subunit ClpC
MKLSASIELVMQFATYEAIAGQFREIEPEHLLMGILKLVELPVEEAEKLAPDAVSIKQVTQEINTIRGQLVDRAIDSTKIRRELRAKMSQGNSPFSGGKVHRSTASKKIFDDAARLADDRGSDALGAQHLFEALLALPTPLIKQVCGDMVGVKEGTLGNTPLLDEYGKNLMKLASEGKLPQVAGWNAQCKVLIDTLKQSDKGCVLLVSDKDTVVQSVVFAAIHTLMKNPNDIWLKKVRIFDLANLVICSVWNSKTAEIFAKLFNEAGSLENVVLFVPAIIHSSSSKPTDNWHAFLQKTLSKYSFKCICRLDPAAYQQLVRNDLSWKRIADFIWLHDQIQNEVPEEL